MLGCLLPDQGHAWYNDNDSNKVDVRPMLQADAVREVLIGYARANEVIEEERMERIARMTPEEARSIYDDLVNGRRAPISPDEAQRLDLRTFGTSKGSSTASAKLSTYSTSNVG